MVDLRGMETRVNFIEYKKLNLKGYTLIEGFPGMGLVSTIATKYVIERLNFEEAGYIDTNIFVPVIRIHNGLPINPSRIYVNDKLKLVAIISEQVIPKFFADRLAKSVADWIVSKGIKRLISLEGIHTDSKAIEEGKTYGIASNARSRKLLSKYGIEAVKDGITTGVTALILLDLKKTNVDALSILVNVKLTADYQASAALVRKLNKMLNLKIDVDPLLKEAQETEKALVEQMQRMRETEKAVKKFDERTPMYT